MPATLAAVALAIDLAGTARLLPDGWPVLSYVLTAAAVAVGLVLALLRVLQTPRGARPRGVGTALIALGLLLGAWLLRGHREVPPDPPLIAASAVACALLLLALRTQHPRART